jgi:hypothetical protein
MGPLDVSGNGHRAKFSSFRSRLNWQILASIATRGSVYTPRSVRLAPADVGYLWGMRT